MRRVLLLLLCLAPLAWGQDCRVIEVKDGDTLRCLSGWRSLTVRLGQIDAPESEQPYGLRARMALAWRVLGRSVQLEPQDRDRYGRVVAKVWLAGEDVNLALVRDGWAWAYRQYLHEPAYLAAERSARGQRAGLWADALPVVPADWRRGQRQGRRQPPDDATVIAPAPASGWQCGSKTRCSQMQSCDEARFYLQSCRLTRLDGDGDGIPCAALCR